MDPDLPPEMLQFIFSLCSASDLLDSVQYVCENWRESVLSPPVWRNKTLPISGCNDLDELKSLLSELPFLRNVSLDDVSPEGVLLLCNYCPSLQRVRFQSGDPQVLGTLTSKLTCLTYLDICFPRCLKVEVAFRECVSSYSSNSFPPLLSTVIFRRCTTDGTVPLSLLNTCLMLEHLMVSLDCEIEPYVKSALTERQCVSKTPGKHNMRIIYLCGAVLCDKNILKAISQFPNLSYLAFKHNVFDDSDVLGTIFQKSQPNIVFLDFSYSFKLTADALISLINACPNLEYLSLMRSFVNDGVFAYILARLNKLQCLNLHGTLITSRLFNNIPAKLPNLTDLNLGACRRMDPQLLKELVNMMPELAIIQGRKGSGSVKGARVGGRPCQFLQLRNFL